MVHAAPVVCTDTAVYTGAVVHTSVVVYAGIVVYRHCCLESRQALRCTQAAVVYTGVVAHARQNRGAH